MNVLETRKLTMRFGGLTAVNQVDLAVHPGEIFSVIGPNGAGKTTVFNAVTGIYEPTEGGVLFEGRELRRKADLRTLAGILLIALFTAFLTLLILELEPLWTASILRNYRYKKLFPWGEAWRDGLGYLGAQGMTLGLSLGLGAVVGGCGAVLIWRRQRRTTNYIAENGICRTFQNIRLFPDMTALENVVMGMDMRLRTRLWDMVLRLPRFFREEREAREEGLRLLQQVGLEREADFLAKNLPYGDQRRLEIARALATRPKLLLLDEPAAGMNPAETVELMALIRKIRDTGITVLLIEHHMRVVMGISDRIAVLDYGVKIAEGTPEEVRRNPKVIEAYLGKEDVG